MLGLTKPNLPQNWLTTDDIHNLLFLKISSTCAIGTRSSFRFPSLLVAAFFNKFLVKLFPFYFFALTNVIISEINA